MSGRAVAHDLCHWTHALRVNLLALAARGADGKHDFDSAPWWRKLRIAIGVIWRAGWPSEASLLRAISRIGRRCRIHPTAVIEAAEIGDEVEIGPHAIVRGSWIGSGTRIEPQACVVGSVVGPRCQVGRGAAVTVCVLMEGAFVSCGPSRQMSIFGRDAFVAQDNQLLDLSFGGPILVEHRGARVSSGSHFLGVAVGHRARIGAGVRVCYGVAVPNDALLVAPPEDLLRRWPDTIEGAVTTRNGTATPVKPR
jgi:NDP-sugar pyrophosphorylase family protein